MRKFHKAGYCWLLGCFLMISPIIAQPKILKEQLINSSLLQYEKAEWEVEVVAAFLNPYNQWDIRLDMVITSPSGKPLVVPCFYEKGDSMNSLWKARFTPQEAGAYSYCFQLKNSKGFCSTLSARTSVSYSLKPGFLHKNNLWTFKFDNGTLFRGLGENVGWEFRKWEDPKYTYDYILPTLTHHGANFFRTWMCSWNLPLEWKQIASTDRYKNTSQYFNPDAIRRMDEFIGMIDSLNLYVMLTLDWHGELISDSEWIHSVYNKANGGPAGTPAEFFTSEKAQSQYKNKLRYIIARWGYSPHIAAWEFFNEIDNAAFSPQDSVLIPHSAITQWHDEMGMFIKNTDPYDHLVTTSVSHRDIIGLNSIAYLDFNQKHIYKRTGKIPATIHTYTADYGKPYVIGEFGYEWDWNIDFRTIAKESDFDYRRGLWYGLFSPTPILPMTWWWEFFDGRGMTAYFKSVRTISDRMLEAGKGSFEETEVKAGNLESYGLKCGNTIFIYLLNNTSVEQIADITLYAGKKENYKMQEFYPEENSFKNMGSIISGDQKISIPAYKLMPGEERVIILENNTTK